MKFTTWRPGMSGIIYMRDPRGYAAYCIADVDEQGKCKLKESRLSWSEANRRIKDLADSEGKIAYSAPEGENLTRLLGQGYLKLEF
ncbi:MAG: hypothetical protein HYU36_24090 [Planctomycetes bacterium]|nr:hypothetical protein [Planctomycetota bacterium]